MTIENGDLVKYKQGGLPGLVMYVDDASCFDWIKCRKSYEDDRPDKIFFINAHNLTIVEKMTKLKLYQHR
jgi:hypothetical protein